MTLLEMVQNLLFNKLTRIYISNAKLEKNQVWDDGLFTIDRTTTNPGYIETLMKSY